MKPHDRDWKAKWIWLADAPAENAWLAFRHEFNLDSKPDQAPTGIACADKYWLWVNGKMVVREGGLKSGPNRSDWYGDEMDLADHLQKGRNLIAILAWNFGKDGASHRNSGQGGLLFQLTTDDRIIASSATWKTICHPAFGQRGDGPSVTLAEKAVDFDARNDMPGWITATFDDSSWQPAVEKGFPPCAPWGKPIPRPIPFWHDREPKSYITDVAFPVTGPAIITARLPANIQLYPYFRVRAAAGLEVIVKIERDKKTSRYITCAGEQEFEIPTWGNGEQVTYEIPAGVELLKITYRETGYASEWLGHFSSSDADLDLLWKKAGRTAYLCMRDTFMDCPDRERSPWPGDTANIIEVILRTLDRRSDQMIVKTFQELAGWASPGGNLWGAVPTSRFPNSFREFPAQTLSLLGFAWPSYWMASGDRSLLEALYPVMRRYLLETFRTQNGIVEHRGPWQIEWGPGIQSWYDWGDNIDAEVIDQALYYKALGALGESAQALQEDGDFSLIEKLRKEIKAAFDSTYWSEEDNAYQSKRHSGFPDDRAQALTILSGLAPSSRFPQLIQSIIKTEQASIYMERYPLTALAKMGDPQSALKRLKRRFAAEIKSPRSTLPEFFGEDSNHAWGGAAIILVANELMGIDVLEPGFRKVLFNPPIDGLEWAETTIPTVLGELFLSFKFGPKTTTYELTIPEKMGVELPIDANTTSITVNGQCYSDIPALLQFNQGKWAITTFHPKCSQTINPMLQKETVVFV